MEATTLAHQRNPWCPSLESGSTSSIAWHVGPWRTKPREFFQLWRRPDSILWLDSIRFFWMLFGLAGTVTMYSTLADCLELGTDSLLAGCSWLERWHWRVNCKFSCWFYLCMYACLFDMKGLLQNGGQCDEHGICHLGRPSYRLQACARYAWSAKRTSSAMTPCCSVHLLLDFHHDNMCLNVCYVFMNCSSSP